MTHPIRHTIHNGQPLTVTRTSDLLIHGPQTTINATHTINQLATQLRDTTDPGNHWIANALDALGTAIAVHLAELRQAAEDHVIDQLEQQWHGGDE